MARTIPWFIRIPAAFLIVGGALLFQPSPAAAQTLDPTFWIPDGEVRATVVSGDTLFVGGSFGQISPPTGGGALVDPVAGTVVESFPKFRGMVLAVVPDGAGGWFIGGSFTLVEGGGRSHLVHISAQNSVLPWDPAPDGPVSALALSNDVLYVAGAFSSIGGAGRAGLAAVEVSSGHATAWAPQVDAFPNVSRIAANATTVYLAGQFSSVNGVPRSNLASVAAGSGDLISWNPGVNGPVYALGMGGGTLYVGGHFSEAGGSVRVNLAAFDLASGVLLPWAPVVSAPYPITYVLSVVYSLGSVYVAGEFDYLNGQARDGVGAIDAVSGVERAFAPAVHEYSVESIAVRSGVAYLGGNIRVVGGELRSGAAAVDANTGDLLPWSPNPNDDVRCVATSGSGVLLGGSFTGAGGVSRMGLAAIDLTTGRPLSWDPSVNGSIQSMALDGNSLYIGGTFSYVGSTFRRGLAEVDVPTASVTNWNPDVPSSFGSSVRTMALTPSLLYIGGDFRYVHGLLSPSLTAVDRVSGYPTGWNPPLTGVVHSILLHGSRVYAGGFFTVPGQPRQHLAAFDASSSALLGWNPNAESEVDALALVGDRLYVGGRFLEIGGQSRTYFAELDESTGQSTAWIPPYASYTRSLGVVGGTLYRGGNGYAVAYDLGTHQLTGWDPSVSDGEVKNFSFSATSVFLGGSFTALGSRPLARLARVSTAISAAVGPPAAITPIRVVRVSPNPVCDRATIRYTISQPAETEVTIYLPSGARVRNVQPPVRLSAGTYTLALDVHSLDSGIYFVRVRAGTTTTVSRVVVIH